MKVRDQRPGQTPRDRGQVGSNKTPKKTSSHQAQETRDPAEIEGAHEVVEARNEAVESALEKQDGGRQFHKAYGEENSQPAANQQRRATAHIAFKNELHLAVDRKGSVDPSTLAPPENPDARKFLEDIGVDLRVPEGWRYMGYVEDGQERRITFNSNGTKDGLEVALSFWPMPEGFPVEKAIQSYEEDAKERLEQGELLEFKITRLGDAVGLLETTWAPKGAASESDYERAYFASRDGSGRPFTAFRGFRPAQEGAEYIILKVSSSIEEFTAHKGLFDAMMQAASVKAS